MSNDYLFELGTEELPPKSLLSLSRSLENSVKASLAEHKLAYESFESFCTPRRLSFVITQLDEQTPVSENKVWGPPAKVGFDENGQATKAALGFCSRNGIKPDQIQVESDGKVEKLCCVKSEGGEQASDLITGFIQKALDQLPIAKRMRWGASRTEFVRPSQWLVLMKDAEVLPASILAQNSGPNTRGHRFLSNQSIIIESPKQYESQLHEDAKVIASFEKRKALIETQVAEEAKKIGGQAVIDPELLDEVTALVEWPVALSGNFDASFLEVPAEALISSMKEHQKYFHVVNESGALMPLFITVSNIEADDYSAIKSGNEKVIRPRLADAAFFFNTDLKQSLASRREKLKSVVFQAKLGSIFDKTERVKKLASHIAETLGYEKRDIELCAELCKSDLVSTMVYEFPEMQGIAGYHYALNDGLDKQVALGVLEHYQPKFAGDELPSTEAGAIVGLADRLDTLSGIFGIGQIPTGSKDPFALRRASVSSLRIIVEKAYDLDLAKLLDFAVQQHASIDTQGSNTQNQALNYVLERFKAWFEDQGIAAEVWQAVSAKALTNPLDINARVHAVNEFYKSEEAKALAAANKRVANILAKNNAEVNQNVEISLFEEAEETALFKALNTAVAETAPLLAEQKYNEALAKLAKLRSVVDAFFDKVMVMADNENVRDNRLSLLNQLRRLFLEIADIRFLAPGK